ncbi:MAG: radical SAM protein [Nitrospirales bacterium]|nr:radical SAM protein [Nitrospirales bacterium]
MTEDLEYFKVTRSLCPVCREVVPAKIVFSGDDVLMVKACREHGETMSLLYRGREAYLSALGINKPALYPLATSVQEYRGCGNCCGICPEHQQHTCLPVIEITDHCNMACPICLVDNHNSHHMPVERFEKIIEALIRAEGVVELINLSGGEPTLHPEFLRLVDAAARPEILNISVSTNGRTLVDNEDLIRELRDRGVFISLQFDGFDDQACASLRGEPVLREKLRLLELLEKHEAPTSLVMTVMRGVNSGEIGRVFRFFLEKDFIASLMIQPVAFTNPALPYDMDRVMTIPDVVKEVVAGSGGLLRERDILNLPCSHPACFALTYLLKLNDGGFIPVTGIAEVGEFLEIVKNRALPGLEPESYERIRECVYSLWSSSGIQPRSESVLKTVRQILRETDRLRKPDDPKAAFRTARQHIKSLFIHHFMDAYNFDFARVVKCCTHYPLEEQRLVPCCIRNNLFSRRS